MTGSKALSGRAMDMSLCQGRFLINVTNLVSFPIRTGIQRVCYEFWSRWPHFGNSIPFIEINRDTIGLLEPSILDDIKELFEGNDPVLQAYALANPKTKMEPNAGWLGLVSTRARVIRQVKAKSALEACRAVISLEESMNANFYNLASEYRPEKIVNLCHDFLVWTNSEHFSLDWNKADNVTEALNNRRRYHHNFFTSTAMREQFVTRINRGDKRQYSVIPPGADGLGRMYRSQVPASKEFVVVGTLEPRKQPIHILEAFERVNASGHEAHLCFAGRMGWLEPADKKRLEQAFETHAWLRWADGPDDEELRSLVQGARATIYISLAEGFGSPPVESLALGVPCIVSEVIPSVRDMAANGQARIAPDDIDALVDAVKSLLDDAEVERLQNEIETLALPTWQGFVDGIVAMVDERIPEKPEETAKLDYAATLDMFVVLAQLREMPRDAFIRALVGVAGEPEAVASKLVAEAAAGDWNNVETLQQVADRLGQAIIPQIYVDAALKGGLPAGNLSGGIDPALRDMWLGILKQRDYRSFVEGIFTGIHRRAISSEEIDQHMPDREERRARTHALFDAINSSEYHDACMRRVMNVSDAKYFDRYNAVSTVWKQKAVASLAFEAAVDRAMLIADDQMFIDILFGDLTGQKPSGERLERWRMLSRQPGGRYAVALEMLLSQQCLEKVIDRNLHIALVHNTATLSGLVDKPKIDSAEFASRLNGLSGRKIDLSELVPTLLGKTKAVHAYGLTRVLQNTADQGDRLVLATLWSMAMGHTDWSDELFAWADTTRSKDFPEVPEWSGTEDVFNMLRRREPTEDETKLIDDVVDQDVVSAAAVLAALRGYEVADVEEALAYIAANSSVFVGKAEQVEELAGKLMRVAPRNTGKAKLRDVFQPERLSLPDSLTAENPLAMYDVVSVSELKEYDGEEFIQITYRKLLLRDADSDGLAAYAAMLKASGDKDKVIRAIATSKEARSKGVDFDGLAAVIAATPTSAKPTLSRRIARLMRKFR